MNLSHHQQAELLRQLVVDYDFTVKDEYLYKGICPRCGKKELYISKSEPWRVCCNRLNKCGYSEST